MRYYYNKKATAEASFFMPDCFPFLMTLRLLGENGYVEYVRQGSQSDLDVAAKNELVVYPCGEPARHLRDCQGKDAYRVEIEYFVSCLEQDRAPELATLSQARTVLEMAMAAKTSMETGQVVTL